MTVKAYAAFGPGEALKPLSYDPGPLGPHDIEIAVTHCGICQSGAPHRQRLGHGS